MSNYKVTDQQLGVISARLKILTVLIICSIVLCFCTYVFSAIRILDAVIWGLALLSIAGALYQAVLLYSLLGRLDNEPKEITPEQQIEANRTETQLFQTRKERSEKESEYLQAEIGRIGLENQLINLKTGRAPDQQVPGIVQKVQRDVNNVVIDLAQADPIIDEAEKKYPQYHEYFSVIRDSLRRRLLEDKE